MSTPDGKEIWRGPVLLQNLKQYGSHVVLAALLVPPLALQRLSARGEACLLRQQL
jgi:hypothetical protein